MASEADPPPESGTDEQSEKLTDEQRALLDDDIKWSNEHAEERVYCNKCRRITLHRLLKTTSKERGEEYDAGMYEPESGVTPSCIYFDMLECCGCREAVLRRTFHCPDFDKGVHARMGNTLVVKDGEVQDDVRYFPPAMSRDLPRWRFKLPLDMRELLEEIYRSLDAENLRLPMMGARTLVDMMIVKQIGDVGDFKKKLKELEEKGYVTARNREVLYAALEVGHAAVHRGHKATKSEVQDVMDIVESMLQAVFVFPKLVEKLKKTTPARPPRPPKGPSSTI